VKPQSYIHLNSNLTLYFNIIHPILEHLKLNYNKNTLVYFTTHTKEQNKYFTIYEILQRKRRSGLFEKLLEVMNSNRNHTRKLRKSASAQSSNHSNFIPNNSQLNKTQSGSAFSLSPEEINTILTTFFLQNNFIEERSKETFKGNSIITEHLDSPAEIKSTTISREQTEILPEETEIIGETTGKISRVSTLKMFSHSDSMLTETLPSGFNSDNQVLQLNSLSQNESRSNTVSIDLLDTLTLLLDNSEEIDLEGIDLAQTPISIQSGSELENLTTLISLLSESNTNKNPQHFNSMEGLPQSMNVSFIPSQNYDDSQIQQNNVRKQNKEDKSPKFINNSIQQKQHTQVISKNKNYPFPKASNSIQLEKGTKSLNKEKISSLGPYQTQNSSSIFHKGNLFPAEVQFEELSTQRNSSAISSFLERGENFSVKEKKSEKKYNYQKVTSVFDCLYSEKLGLKETYSNGTGTPLSKELKKAIILPEDKIASLGVAIENYAEGLKSSKKRFYELQKSYDQSHETEMFIE